jgi:RNA polymerase sigma factor (sigma-70 family)
MVLGLCRLLLRDPVEAEDAAQQVFLSAHRAVLRGSAPRDAPRWLAAIARNECRARIHVRMREPLALPELPSDLPDPLAAAIRATDLEAIWAAISELPRHQRRALLLRELGGLSYHELGRALGVSHSAVESLLFRARQQVRSLIAAATPFALRDDLARLIPGFEPANAGLVARVAALPVTLKLASAAVGVGVVVTGAAQLPDDHRQPVSRPDAAAPAPRPTSTGRLRGSSLAGDVLTPAVPVRAARREGHEAERETEHEQRGRASEQPEPEHANEPETEEVERNTAETHPAESSDHSGSDGSGSDGSSSSGGDSEPAGSDG